MEWVKFDDPFFAFLPSNHENANLVFCESRENLISLDARKPGNSISERISRESFHCTRPMIISQFPFLLFKIRKLGKLFRLEDDFLYHWQSTEQRTFQKFVPVNSILQSFFSISFGRKIWRSLGENNKNRLFLFISVFLTPTKS